MPWYVPVACSADLDHLLACSWTATPSGRHRVVPDACIDMLWLSTGHAWVCGPETTAWDFELPHDTTGVGVRFRPGAAPTALGVSAASLRETRIPLRSVVGNDVERELLDQIDGEVGPDARRRRLERFVGDLVEGDTLARDTVDTIARDTVDTRAFSDLVLNVLASTPRANARELAELLGMSVRQLHRRSLFSFGYGPSTLARILRFQRFLAMAEGSDRHRNRLADLAIDAGYSDQAHLARDCRAITGQTPTMFLVHYFPTFPDMSDPYKTLEAFSVTMCA